MTQENKIERVHCNRCLQQTNHEVIATRVVNESEEIGNDECLTDIDWQVTYTMLQCRGCGTITLRRHLLSYGNGVDETDYFPPPISRQMPKWIFDLPAGFQSLIDEIYTALHANSKCLALMGTRALVDLFMSATIGDIGGFQRKLEKLVEDGYLSKKNREILEPALDAGHAATHRGHDPSVEDVNLVFDIVENLLQPLALKIKVENLKKHTPKRQGKP
ncbi:MAG: DUF4145 domain-containing protein [Sedimentisphaerales bacterium]|nr:DUF4145 domain-containing protein [Sedimentisphaerales bacterium]